MARDAAAEIIAEAKGRRMIRWIAALLALLAGTGEVRADAFSNTAPFTSGSTLTPTGASTPQSIATIAAQQGVLLDTFRLAADVDDTAAMTRAVAAGVPILLGPKTYTINNYTMAGTPTAFVLRGIPGASIIQRTSASGSQFFNITATNVVIDGVTFDMNSGSVSANQWGVRLAQGGQTVSVRNSVFKNNSGTIGTCLVLSSTGPAALGSFDISHNEMSGCTFNTLYLASVTQGVVADNYIHDVTGLALFASSNGTASSTNLLSDVVIRGNRIARSTSTAISIGGYAPPYSFTFSPATRVLVADNMIEDAGGYGISLEGDYCSAIGNTVAKSTSGATAFGGIDTLSRWSKIANNIVTMPGSNWGIDTGGSIEAEITGNSVTMTQGIGLNVGGNQNSLVSQNHVMISGGTIGIADYAVESGGGAVFPTLASGTVIENNVIDMVNSSATGINLIDSPGGYPNTTYQVVRRNSFNVSGSGISPSQCIVFWGSNASALFEGNLYNGSNRVFGDPNGNGDFIFDWVYLGGTVSGTSSTTAIRSITPRPFSTYNTTSIQYVIPSAGGSGYTGATTLAASGSTGGSGWVGTPQIIGGVIVGVRTTAFGSAYTGTITVAATDSGGGTGATFTVGNTPKLPISATLTYLGNALTVLKTTTGGTIGMTLTHPIQIQIGTAVQMQALSSNSWNILNYTQAIFAIGSLPTCDASSNGSIVHVTGSVSGKWEARCNATNWIAPDGTTIN